MFSIYPWKFSLGPVPEPPVRPGLHPYSIENENFDIIGTIYCQEEMIFPATSLKKLNKDCYTKFQTFYDTDENESRKIEELVSKNPSNVELGDIESVSTISLESYYFQHDLFEIKME